MTTTTTLPIERRSLPRRGLLLSAVAAVAATAALGAGVIVVQSEDDATRPATLSHSSAAVSGLMGSADATERWATGGAGRPDSADAAERWATGDSSVLDAGRHASADAAERSAG